MVVQQGLKITEELVQRVEVVYVLGLFLLGKHRKKVSHLLQSMDDGVENIRRIHMTLYHLGETERNHYFFNRFDCWDL